MCGIYCELCAGDSKKHFCVQTDQQLKSFLNCRGPDSCNSITKCIRTNNGDAVQSMFFYGAVLWMQGDTLTPQPLENDSGILVYNGDIFDTDWDKSISDTMQIMTMFCGNCTNGRTGRKERVLNIITNLKGPFSMVYYDKVLNVLFFCRDAIGRNSLIFYSKDDTVIISSILGRQYEGAIEIPASHIFVMDLNDLTMSNHDRGTLEYTKLQTVDGWFRQMQERQSLPDDTINTEIIELIAPEPEDLNLINLIENAATVTKCKKEAMKTILQNHTVCETVDRLTALLRASVKIRLDTQPYKCKECINTGQDCTGHCTVGVLFSGGLDCTILALLADEYLPKDQPIDLINVAFKGDISGSYDVPDRLTGRLAVAELKSLRPARKWKFREVNVGEQELRREQDNTIADLVYPRRTILDESIGSALWFAARASDEHSTSSCRVLLLGSGADELFGGYTRHRNALKRSSWSGLHRELSLDWRRISYRNLARDNRVIGHHGRQPRMPYLDEDFTKYALQLKPWKRCIPSCACGPGLGDKLFLRLVAFKLGLTEVSSLPKRALQFGSRIANKKENGADLSERFKNFRL